MLFSLIEFSRALAARENWRKSEDLAVVEWRDSLPVLPQSLADGFKYLRIHLGQEAVVQKNCEGVKERIEGKRLLPQILSEINKSLLISHCLYKVWANEPLRAVA